MTLSTYTLKCMLLFGLFIHSTCALEFEVEQIAPEVVTNLQLSQFDFEGTGLGPTLFKLTLNNLNDSKKYDDLELYYTLTLSQGASTQRLYRGKSKLFSLEANSFTEVLSNDFLRESGSSSPIHLYYVLESMAASPLKTNILNKGHIPAGTLTFSFELRGRNTSLSPAPLTVSIEYPRQVNPLYPGIALGDNIGNRKVSSPSILFTWSSDLLPFMYAGCTHCASQDVFELELFRKSVYSDEQDLASMRPIFSRRLQNNSYLLNASIELERGQTYYWRVKGLLQGLSEGVITSPTFRFTYDKTESINQEELMLLLRSILSYSQRENLIELIHSHGDEIDIKIDGKPISVEQLKSLEKALQKGSKKIHAVRVE